MIIRLIITAWLPWLTISAFQITSGYSWTIPKSRFTKMPFSSSGTLNRNISTSPCAARGTLCGTEVRDCQERSTCFLALPSSEYSRLILQPKRLGRAASLVKIENVPGSVASSIRKISFSRVFMANSSVEFGLNLTHCT